MALNYGSHNQEYAENVTSDTIDAPTGSAGDICVLLVSISAWDPGSYPPLITPSGWTLEASDTYTAGTYDSMSAVYTKTFAGTAGETVSLTWTGSVASSIGSVCARYTPTAGETVDTGNASIEDVGDRGTQTSTGTAALTVADGDTVVMLAVDNYFSDLGAISWPGSYTEDFDNTAGGADSGGARRLYTSGGSTGTLTITHSASEYHAVCAVNFLAGDQSIAKTDSATLAEGRAELAGVAVDSVTATDTSLGIGDSSTGWLLPDGDGTTAWTGSWSAIDEAPGSESDADYVTSPPNADGSAFFTLQDMPADFDTGETVKLSIRCRVPDIVAGATMALYAQIFQSNETSTLTSETIVDRFTAGSATWRTYVVHLAATASDKATWDGARLRLRADYTAAP